ncbi:DUF262 domain-containing protein [Xenorhabdus nematophila]|uniref:DUF262 domain-containing protein n=1 Tax=Xenorhabdus nematophila TaxID=628 RepID=UPI002F2B460D
MDGLQRFSSYLHLRGELIAEHMEIQKGEKLTFSDCDILKSLNGLTYDDLPLALKIKLKRSFVRVEVVRKGSDNKFKYHMFKRLNTGGEALTQQQIRNCTIRMLDPKFNDFIIRLSKDEHYSKCISFISESQRFGAFDQELVLRYFTFKNNRNKFKHDIADFLTEYMENISSEQLEFDYDDNEKNFKKVFEILSKTHGDRIFGRIGADNKIQSNFNIYHFESITIGIQSIIKHIDQTDDEIIENLKNKILELKNDSTFKTETTGGGKNSPGPLTRRIDIAKQYFESVIK